MAMSCGFNAVDCLGVALAAVLDGAASAEKRTMIRTVDLVAQLAAIARVSGVPHNAVVALVALRTVVFGRSSEQQ
jgi:hypothetical protein